MWIRCTNPATRRLYDASVMDEPVDFTDDGKARVTRKVGEAMVEHYPSVEPVETDSSEVSRDANDSA